MTNVTITVSKAVDEAVASTRSTSAIDNRAIIHSQQAKKASTSQQARGSLSTVRRTWVANERSTC